MLKRVDEPIRPDPVASAEEAALTYVSDTEPGIRRVRAGRGFRYLLPDGGRLEDFDALDRIRNLAIPPAWTDVWISPEPDGHIQATGRDVKGRKQYRYHPRWVAVRDEAKYGSLVAFAHALPGLRAQLDEDLRGRGLSRERVIASIVWLLDNTMIRIGNAAYARDNKSFGLTTLRDRHVEIEGSRLRFRFKGKSGREWNLQLTDRRIARVVRGAQEIPGQHLFQYIDEAGERRALRSEDVNSYIRENAGADFSAKTFRTWGGTLLALGLLSREPLPDTRTATTRVLNQAVDKIASALVNTRSVCRKCYVHPLVVDTWLDGRLDDEMRELRSRTRRPRAGLDLEETLLLKWLELKGQT